MEFNIKRIYKFDLNGNLLGKTNITELIYEYKLSHQVIYRDIRKCIIFDNKYVLSFTKKFIQGKVKRNMSKKKFLNVYDYNKEIVFTGSVKEICDKYNLKQPNVQRYVKNCSVLKKKKIIICEGDLPNTVQIKPTNRKEYPVIDPNQIVYVYDLRGRFIFEETYDNTIQFFSTMTNFNEDLLKRKIHNKRSYLDYFVCLDKKDANKLIKSNTIYLYDRTLKLIKKAPIEDLMEITGLNKKQIQRSYHDHRNDIPRLVRSKWYFSTKSLV